MISNQHKKYLKYKNKYLSLSGGSTANHSKRFSSHYKLRNIPLISFSDIEGQIPFNNEDESYELLENTEWARDNKSEFEKLVKTLITFKFSDNKTELSLTIGPCSMAFTGDLIDNGPYSIRLMKAFLKLKTVLPNRIILIGGNRDFNKIRLGIELYIEKQNSQPGDYPWSFCENALDMYKKLKDNNYSFRQKSIPEYLQVKLSANGKKWFEDGNDDNYKKSYESDDKIIERLSIIFYNTLGIPTFENIISELNTLFFNDNSFLKLKVNKNSTTSSFTTDAIDAQSQKDYETTAKFICVIQMIMSFIWEESTIPDFLKKYNGLYYKYLSCVHLVATFELNNKRGILSHGGVPTVDDQVALTSPFGFTTDKSLLLTHDITTTLANLNKIIEEIDKEKNDTLTAYAKIRDIGYSSSHEHVKLINKLVVLTAETDDNKNPNIASGAKFSTLHRKPMEDYGNIKGGSTGYSWNILNIKIPSKSSNLFDYNISGHIPQNFSPSYHMIKEGTLNINMDVSKDDGLAANDYSYSILYLDPKENMTFIIGRIKFDDEKNTNIIYDPPELKSKLNKKIHYYLQPIQIKESQKIAKSNTIPKTNYICKTGKKFTRIISVNEI